MNTESFTSIAGLRQAIERDAREMSRYPVRFILVSGVAAWREVVGLLDEMGIRSLRLSTLVDGDELPTLRSVQSVLADLTASLAIRPLSEVLRLVPRMAAPYLSWLTSIQMLGHVRVFVPLLDVSAMVAPLLEQMQQYLTHSPDVWSYEGEGNATIWLAPEHYRCLPGQRLEGLRDYLQWWELGGGEAATVATVYADMIDGSRGQVDLRVAPTAYDVVALSCGLHAELRREFGTDAQWRWLASKLQPEDTLATAAARLLDVSRPNPGQLFKLWRRQSPELRWLAWLWLKFSARNDDLADQALAESTSPEHFAELVAHAVFEAPRADTAWLARRKDLLMDLADGELPASFWPRWQAVDDPLLRLSGLLGASAFGRQAIVECVGQLVRARSPQERWLPIIELAYPLLHSYLTANPLGGALGEYVYAYKLSRLADQPLPELQAALATWASTRGLWQYETRPQVLHRHHSAPEQAQWVDGLGIEWLGLLRELLTTQGYAVQIDLARVNLPSITASNRDWDEAHVIRGLDSYAHSHEYAYPAALVHQIELVAGIVDAVAKRLRDAASVMLTSDHGSTRFAGSGERVPVPEGYEAHRWGRYARNVEPGAAAPPDCDAWVAEGEWLVLATHALFEGGVAPGEVHGGATPEEVLVPVMYVTHAAQTTLRVAHSDALVSLDVRGNGKLRVTLSAPCSLIELHRPRGIVTCDVVSGVECVFHLRAIEPGHHSAEVVADGHRLGRIEFECQRGLVENDMGL